ncbi:MAG TPA: DUF4350 domain-containing protein [Candidatus Ozemobacteraceae bacterium]|nr:DUF4350 domain-containing protein [Candidatus Ozemobacteraceae bacterium]
MNLLRGYAILLLSLFIFTMWGLNLVSLSKFEKEVPDESKRRTITTEEERVETTQKQIQPRPFLAFFLRRLGYTIDFSSAPPAEPEGLAIIIDPLTGMNQERMRAFYSWCQSGGHLLIITRQSHPLAQVFGADHDNRIGMRDENLQYTFSWLSDASRLSVDQGGLNNRRGMSFLPLFSTRHGKPLVLSTWRGHGSATMMSGYGFCDADALSRGNNAIFLARLVRRLAPKMRVRFYDPDPLSAVQVRIKKVKVNIDVPPPMKKEMEPYLSLWSLVRANPISWVLLQLLIGLALYFLAIGRRLGQPVPLPPLEPPPQHFLESMGRLYVRFGTPAAVAAQMASWHLRSLKRRYRLPSDTLVSDVCAQIVQATPDERKRLQTLLVQLQEMGGQESLDPVRLVHHLRLLETMRKELKIHD